MDVNAAEVNTSMGDQGKHDKHVELAKKVGAGAAIAGGGYLIYKNVADRVAKRTVKSKAEAEALHKEARDKVIKKETANVDKASAEFLDAPDDLGQRKKYLEALEKEQNKLMSENKDLAKTSVYGELNTEGKEGLKQVSKLGGTDAKVLSDNIAKEQLEKSQDRIDKIAETLGMKKEKGVWKKGENAGKKLSKQEIERIKGIQADNSKALREFDIGKSDVYNEYKDAARTADPNMSTKDILEKNKADKEAAKPPEGGVEAKPPEGGAANTFDDTLADTQATAEENADILSTGEPAAVEKLDAKLLEDAGEKAVEVGAETELKG